MVRFVVNLTPAAGKVAPEDFSGLDAQLHTEDGFAADVVLETNQNRNLFLAAIAFAAVMIIAENIMVAHQSDGDMSWLQQLHWVFSPVSQYGGTNPQFFIMVGLPVLMLVGVAIFAVYKRVTRAASTTELFDRFQQGGWLAELTSTGVMVPIGRTVGVLKVLTRPGVPADAVTAVVNHFSKAKLVDKVKIANAFRGVKMWQAMPAGQLDPTLPDGVYLTRQIGIQSSSMRVAFPKGGLLDLHGLKRDVSPAYRIVYGLLLVVAVVVLVVASRAL